MNGKVLIRSARREDSNDWERMRHALWPGAADEHAREVEQFFGPTRRDPLEVLLAIDGAGRAVGFVELSIRAIALGCVTDRVAYVEGWYVEPDARRRGIGAALIRSAEEFGRSQGCTELASDTELDNLASAAAHLALGFEETGRIVCFRKVLSTPAKASPSCRAFHSP